MQEPRGWGENTGAAEHNKETAVAAQEVGVLLEGEHRDSEERRAGRGWACPQVRSHDGGEHS